MLAEIVRRASGVTTRPLWNSSLISYGFLLPGGDVCPLPDLTLPLRAPARGWGWDDISYLVATYPKATRVREIATILGRTLSSVRGKARRLGMRRPLRGRARKSYLHALVPRSASGRAIWNSVAIENLAALWRRLYAPTCIARMLGLTPGAVSEAARRAGLPERAGLPLIMECRSGDPMAAPENAVISGQMIRKTCSITRRPFYVRPQDRKRVHFSLLGRRLLRVRAEAENSFDVHPGILMQSFSQAHGSGMHA